MSKLEQFLSKAIPAHAAQNSAHLGDRTKYVGASDIVGCPRKAVLSKLDPKPFTSKQLLIFSRGHAAQAMYAEIFRAGGASFDEEVEFKHPDEPAILCHVDLMFYTTRQTKRVHIVEMKSTNGIPAEPYSTWVDQLQIQMGLAKKNLDPQTEITGSVLAVDMNAGDYKEFNGHTPNDEVFDFFMAKGNKILAALNGEIEVSPEPGPFCGKCLYRGDCPSFERNAIELPADTERSALAYAKLKEQERQLKGAIEVLKDDIISFTGEESSIRAKSEAVAVSVSIVPPSVTVDSKKLKAQFPDAYQACSKERAGYTKLDVTPLTKAAEEKEAA